MPPPSDPNHPGDGAADPAQSDAATEWRLPRGLFSAGERIAGRYEVVRFIARGGIGEVYEVLDRQLGDRLALKMLQAHEALDDVARERFRREIQLARRVTHGNVCRLYDAGLHDLQPFCTMELVGGETLHDHVEKYGPLTEQQALPVLRQMADGLAAAHAKGIVHRDFKSSNVMLEPVAGAAVETGPWRAVITDFGLARPVVDEDPGMFRTDHGGVSGTIAFMAPEQLVDNEPSPTTDIYALGIVLFHLLTGELPFEANTPIGVMIRRLQEPAPSPRDHLPALDRRWESAILRCLERRPEDRFQSAADIVTAVEGDGVAAVPSRQRRRRRQLLSFLVAAAVVLAAALLAPSWQRRAPVSLVADDPIQLTSTPGLEIDPAISPDGRWLAYASDHTGAFELWLRPFDGPGESRKLAESSGGVQPAFSPDGRQLAYVDQQRGGIYVIPVAGGAPRRLSDFGSRPSWSPDGRRLAFQSEARKDISERTLAAMPPSTLWLVELDGAGSPESLTEAGEPTGGHGEPSFSPDGSQLAFSSGNRRRSKIWTLDLESAQLEALISEARININPLYSQDGAGLIYIGISSRGRQSASYAVWRQALDRRGRSVGEPQRLTQLGIATIRQLALAPSDQALVYAALSTVSSLEQLDLDDAGAAAGTQRLFTDRGQRNSRAAFSPDGAYVVFDRWSKGTNLDLWMRGAGSERQLTVSPEWDSQAVWLADGSGLTFFSEREGRRGLWRLLFAGDPENGAVEIEFLADIGTDADWARLDPAGERVAYHSSKDSAGLDIWIHELDGGESRRLTQDPELAGFPIWSPDGSQLGLEIRRDGSTHVAIMPAEGGEIVQLTFEEGESWPYSFSPDGAKIAFAGRRDGLWNLYWVRIDDGHVEQLTAESSLNGYVRYPAFSPAGDSVLYERARTVGDLWRVDLRPES